MFKKIALAAFTVASLSAFAQNGEWTKYDTYQISKIDINSASSWDISKIVAHDLKGVNANDAYTINTFISNAPADEAWAIEKGLANNYKQASMVRDEVAQARYGTTSDYAWLSYPPLTWSGTPGQNSWSNMTMSDSTPMAMSNNMDADVAMTDDNSRPMRMIMSNHGRHDINYDQTITILGAALSETERSNLVEVFHPTTSDPTFYTNSYLLDALTRVIQSNANMVGHLGRYEWYNHFDKDYYNKKSAW